MASLHPAVLVAAVFAAAFVPPILYAAWVRNVEEHAREPWGSLSKAFGWGATGGVVIALVLNTVLSGRPDALEGTGITAFIFTAVVVAPVVEEATKAFGLIAVDDDHVEVEDGLVYGAAAGFGFAATENLVYAGSAYLDGGVSALAMSLIIRSVSSAFLHGAASALVGYAMWKQRAGEGSGAGLFTMYGVAVLLHAAYNLGASLQVWAGFFGSIALAWITFTWVRRRVRELDRRPAPNARW